MRLGVFSFVFFTVLFGQLVASQAGLESWQEEALKRVRADWRSDPMRDGLLEQVKEGTLELDLAEAKARGFRFG